MGKFSYFFYRYDCHSYSMNSHYIQSIISLILVLQSFYYLTFIKIYKVIIKYRTMRQTFLSSFCKKQNPDPNKILSSAKSAEKNSKIKDQPQADINKLSIQDDVIPKNNIKRISTLNWDSDQEIPNIEQKSPEYEFQNKDMDIQQNKKRSSKALKTKQIKNDNKGQEKAQSQNQFDNFTDKTPVWATIQNCKDKQGRPANHPDYDCTTLEIPQKAWKQFTAPMKQFWKIKSENFDKIILFKLGKFYELFYDDAAVGNKYLNLKWMGTKMHVGFPQKTLQKYTAQLLKYGFKVVVVEQMQTPDQMQERIKSQKKQQRKSEKVIQRGVTQILTKGTTPPADLQQYLPNYLISVREQSGNYAFSLLQVGTNTIIVGLANDFQHLKTILYQTRPVQLLYDPQNLSIKTVKIMSQSFLQMIISKLYNKQNIWHHLNAINEIQSLSSQKILNKPKLFQYVDQMNSRDKKLIYQTLSGLFTYLKSVFKYDYVINAAKFSFYQKKEMKTNMVLDSQALQHLQLFQTSIGQFGSLFSVVDRTKTKFGKRLLRRWIMSPLYNVDRINDRLDAIQDLHELSISAETVAQRFKKLPDIEKITNKLYHYAVRAQCSKAIYFEDINTSRLRQFRQLFKNFEMAWGSIEILRSHLKSIKSKRLKQLLQLNDDSSQQIKQQIFFQEYASQQQQTVTKKLLPNVLQHLNQFKAFVVWDEDMPIPQKGLAEKYDLLKDEQEAIKKQLNEYLQSARLLFKDSSIKFTHTKQRYELQISQKLDKKRPEDYIFSSKRAGFSRYVTSQTKNFVKRLQKVQDQLKNQMGLFVGFFFEHFKSKQRIWEQFIQILAQIDCLISISNYSFSGSNVRPKFQRNQFKIQNAVHPCLAYLDFIPNDIIFDKKVIFLTGPNMGGKSTLLRTVCLLTVMAQTGFYVPASSYSCPLIDRIFTRIGASDHLQEGKSTFFIQMEETRNVLIHGSENSLVIMDQLGRGTSTFDGMSIAYSVLEQITQNIGCYCLFATHYHTLAEQQQKNPKISFCMMDYKVLDKNQIIFLYKLKDGNACNSFGVNVARVAGINQQILQMANKKANEMHLLIEKKKNNAFNEIVKFIKN